MKKCTQLLLVAAMAGSLAACSLTPEEKLERAEESFAAGDFASAKIDLTSALKELSGNAYGLRLLAQTQLELGDGEGASNSLERLKALGDWSENDTILLAEAALLRGQPEAALETVSSLTTAESARISALAHLQKEDIEAAQSAFNRGLVAAGPKARLRAELARFYLAAGDLGAARSMIEAAKGENADLIDVQIADGQISAAQGQPQASLQAFEKVLKSRPANRIALLGRVAALGDMGKLDEAEDALSDLSSQPGDIDYAYLKAKIASERGQWDDVRKVLQPLEAAMRDKPQTSTLYGLALAKSGQPQQARAQLAPLISKFPRSRALRVAVAEVELAGNDPAAAAKSMRPVAERADASREELQLMTKIAERLNDPSAAGYRARAKLPQGERFASLLAKGDQALRAKNWTQAVDAYQSIMGITDGSNALVLNNLAYALGQTGRAEEGLAYAERALQLEPESASILDTVAALKLALGRDREEAVKLLEKASRLAPDNRQIAARLKRARS